MGGSASNPTEAQLLPSFAEPVSALDPVGAGADPAGEILPDAEQAAQKRRDPTPTNSPVMARAEIAIEQSLPGLLAALRPSQRAGSIVDEEGQPVVGAWVSDGDELVRTDAEGRFVLSEGGGTWLVVAPGYRPARAESGAVALSLQPFMPRAIYLPYEQLWQTETMAWALELARDGTINAIVVDIKEEGGATLPLAATADGLRLDAVVDTGTDVGAFLRELGEMDVYRIARQVTFLDRRLAQGRPETALRLADGTALDDGAYAWTDPRADEVRSYNIAIAAAAAPYFDEIQFDYVRYPGNSKLAFSKALDAEARARSIAGFAEEAAAVLHRRGVAISFALFGITAINSGDAGIGQNLEDLADRVDHVAPMVYPSAWPVGSFGAGYPAAEPGRVVAASIASAVQRVRAAGNAVVRPWLQDFQDYGPAGLSCGAVEVAAQIKASSEAGGVGFMLWDQSLRYALSTLRSEQEIPE